MPSLLNAAADVPVVTICCLSSGQQLPVGDGVGVGVKVGVGVGVGVPVAVGVGVGVGVTSG